MLTRFVKKAFERIGLDLRRRVDPSLPFLHRVSLDDSEFQFWITNQHTKSWWHKPVIGMNAELRSLKAFCVPGTTVIEVGAHHGLHTVAMCRWVGERGRVHAIEANADNALTLFANVAANGITNCCCCHAAAGERSGNIDVDGESVAAVDNVGRSTPVVSLDDYCADREIKRVDILKIDVEGYEAHVLRGAPRLLAQRPKIALELHLDDIARYGGDADEVLRLLPLEQYTGQMMVRARDWDTLVAVDSATDLPTGGVVNLFLTPIG